MSLFTQKEIDNLVRPILAHAQVDPRQAALHAAVSHLIEPGDQSMGLLLHTLGAERTIEALVERLSADQLVQKNGQQIGDQLETSFQDGFANVWNNAKERWLPRLSKSAVLESFEISRQLGFSLLPFTDSKYPQQFDGLDYARPPLLWLVGNLGLLSASYSVAIVGSRNSSPYGARVASELAAVASENQIVTISGGAYGIDSIVHKSTLNLQGQTVAILAGGLEHLYPKGNAELLRTIGKVGLLVAEQPPPITPARWRFLQRNRLIAALSSATVIVEAGKTSGALNTARHAITLGRGIAVVPGPIESPFSVGCHDLLNELPSEVRLLARTRELLDLVGMQVDLSTSNEGMGALEKRALDAIGRKTVEAWEVQRLAGLTLKETQIALGSLELLGLIQRFGAAYAQNAI